MNTLASCGAYITAGNFGLGTVGDDVLQLRHDGDESGVARGTRDGLGRGVEGWELNRVGLEVVDG